MLYPLAVIFCGVAVCYRMVIFLDVQPSDEIMQIESDFDSGNILVKHESETEVVLTIRADSNAAYYQWFYFRATSTTPCTLRIANAAGASYPHAWSGYQVLASHDEETWFRVPTQYDGANLVFEHSAEHPTVSYAFFVPYTARQREAFLDECAAAPGVERRVVGRSIQDRPLDLLVIGEGTKKVWFIARQHAGESMAEWATEGFVRRLLDLSDTAAQSLRKKAQIYVIPNMNPDGSYLGNLRANAAGVDLNRSWDKPSERCPEIVAVLDAIENTGVDMLIDMHGDEERPFIWIFQPNVELSPEVAAHQQQFEAELARRNPQLHPAPKSVASVQSGDLGLSTNYIVATYNCPSWTIELPFKAVPGPNGEHDSLLAAGCLNFGRICVEALDVIIE